MAWKRYLTSWSRYRHSSGFGIHSPFAYRFVRHVWRQPLSYYAYEGIHQLIASIKSETTRKQRREIGLIDEREARLLFRLANFFNPQHMLQVGAATGIEAIAMLEVSRTSHLFLYDKQLAQNTLAVRVLQSQLNRIDCYDDMAVITDEFLRASSVATEPSMALIHLPVDETVLKRLIDSETVVVMRNLRRSGAMRALFDTACTLMDKGQTYTNGKIAIIIPNPKLQREDFILWL